MATPLETRTSAPVHELETRAHGLAARMPELLIEARRVAHTVTHGIHGRRRAGPGETFWQFRHFENSDAATTIDWRRSASSQHLFVREREWEAAHTAWFWVDLSASMGFRSHLARATKAERAVVLSLALAELLVRGGERIGLIGGPPWTSRGAVRRLAEAIAQRLFGADMDTSLPPMAALGRFSECLLLSDFLEPIDQIAPRLESLAALGVRGHLVQILDPAEETLPYAGRTEFAASEGADRMIAERAENLRERFIERLAAHRESLRQITRKLDWTLIVHRTDRPPEETLLTIHTRLAGLERDYRHRPASSSMKSTAA